MTSTEIPTAHDNLTDRELQARLIYSIIVAGKNAKFAMEKVDKLILLANSYNYDNLFSLFRFLIKFGILENSLRTIKTGNYTKLSAAIKAIILSKLDPRTCTLEELEAIPGIGPKTSRFFLLWTRPDVQHAALDVHILRWLSKQGFNAPKQTPTGKKYAELEQVFLEEAKNRGLTPRELDAKIWSEATGII